MRLNDKNIALANELRAIVQTRTKTIDDGEAVAMVLLWSFLMDHALPDHLAVDVDGLARAQLDAFAEWARENMRLEKAQ